MADPVSNLAACRPTILDMSDPMDRATEAATFVYADSEKGECDACHRGIWIGPKIRSALATGLAKNKVCFNCAAKLIAIGNIGNVYSLNNPEADPRA